MVKCEDAEMVEDDAEILPTAGVKVEPLTPDTNANYQGILAWTFGHMSCHINIIQFRFFFIVCDANGGGQNDAGHGENNFAIQFSCDIDALSIQMKLIYQTKRIKFVYEIQSKF